VRGFGADCDGGVGGCRGDSLGGGGGGGAAAASGLPQPEQILAFGRLMRPQLEHVGPVVIVLFSLSSNHNRDSLFRLASLRVEVTARRT
jgi:hypothetical protein